MEETQCYPMLIRCGCMVFIGFDHLLFSLTVLVITTITMTRSMSRFFAKIHLRSQLTTL